MIVKKAPESISEVEFIIFPSIFLAGSIEMDKAEDWQKRAEKIIYINEGNRVETLVLNPRRESWDPTWEQTRNNPEFRKQVSWELGCLEKCTSILMYFAPGTISPISLLEFGLWARSGKLVVVCPEGFHRKGNIDITCERYNIPNFENLESAINYIFKSKK